MNTNERESQENILRISHIVSKAFSLGKEHKTDEAYETLRPYLERDEVPTYFCQPVGWTIYRYVKEKLSTLSPKEAKVIFGYYLNFCSHKPDMVHSYMLVLAMMYAKLHMQEFPFVDFCRSWDLDSLRDEDYVSTEGKGSDGKPVVYQSLAIKVATLLYKEIKGTESPKFAGEFLPFFEKVLQRCPDYEFTPLYIANLHAWQGDKDIAIAMFKRMLVHRQQWYLWQHLGDLMGDDIKLSCYCKTLTLIDKEEYIGKIHLVLSSLLINQFPEQAAYELQAYVNTYQRNGWKCNAMAYEIKKQLPSVTPTPNGKSFYMQHTIAAEEFVFSDYPQEEFVFTGVMTYANGKMRACLSNHKKHLFAKLPLTPQLRKANDGDVFTCRYNFQDSHVDILTLHPTGKRVSVNMSKSASKQTSDKGKMVEGKVRIKSDKPFAFLDQYFISPRLRRSCGLVDGQMIKAVVTQLQDGRWRVIKILSTS